MEKAEPQLKQNLASSGFAISFPQFAQLTTPLDLFDGGSSATSASEAEGIPGTSPDDPGRDGASARP
eukprot:2887003-Karenia_brevis.AAC.1